MILCGLSFGQTTIDTIQYSTPKKKLKHPHKKSIQVTPHIGFTTVAMMSTGYGITVKYKQDNYLTYGITAGEYSAESSIWDENEGRVEYYMGIIGMGYSDEHRFGSIYGGVGNLYLSYNYGPDYCGEYANEWGRCESSLIGGILGGEGGLKYGTVGLALEGKIVINKIHTFWGLGLALVLDIPIGKPLF